MTVSEITKNSASLEWTGGKGSVVLNDKTVAEGESSPFILKELKSSTEYSVKIVNSSGESGLVKFTTAEPTYKEVTITCDLKGKESGSTVANPHSAFYIWQSNALQPPDSTAWIEIGSTASSSYVRIDELDGTVQAISTAMTPNAHIAQFKFKYNVIEEIKRYDSNYFTNRGATTFAEELVIAKSEIVSQISNTSGLGSGASGATYMATRYWGNSVWKGSSIVSGTTVKLATESIDNENIDDQGNVTILAYTEASDSTKASSVSIDYANLELTFLVEE